MRHKIILMLLMAIVGIGLFAVPAQVIFKDNTNATLLLVRQEDPNYPIATPVESRWVMRAYLSTDNVIDPLGIDGNPTNDDTYLQDIPLIFGPNSAFGSSGAYVPDNMLGSYLYLRIFNSTVFENATKYMSFHTPYHVATGGAVNVTIIPDYGWFDNPVWQWIAPQPTTHIISGAITSQWDLSGVEISATDIVPTDITYDAGAYTVTVPDGWDGTVTPYKEGYIFEPASYTYTDVIADTPNQDFVMKTVVVPGVPTNLSPNATTLTYTEPTAVVLTWDAVAIAEGYKLQWNEGEIQDLGNVLTWTTPALDAGTYTWKVCAYNNTATKSYTPVRVQINSRSNSPANSPKADGGWAEASFDVNIVTYDIPDGTPVTPPDATVTVTITVTGGNANFGSGVLPPWVNPSFVPVEQYFLDLIGAGPWTITFNTTAPWGAYFLNGIWNAVQNSGVEISFTVTAAKDIEDLPIILGESDPTLPVELSYFAATLTAENFVNIAWTTQTETNMNGFNIYRNEGSENLAGAIQIAYIPATNTSTTQNYKHIDREVENGHTYYYWLECVEMNNHSTFNGPSPVYVDGPTPPVLPEYTTMQNAYPNPFRAGSGTTIAVEVKKGDSGTVTIYNILGQVVKTFSLTEGTNNLNWNGRDSKGNLCGNGIYFYKLSTNSLNQTKKMVIVK
ncbi:MAG: T9SS type A sorting domain-containing protein [Candidatus Cloacimonas acidaminovorans]|nr:T9SS type A sorting domain-containing protein [Candidatus Cloacimonas acidaminovorans]